MLKFRTVADTLKTSGIIVNPHTSPAFGSTAIIVIVNPTDCVIVENAQRELNTKHAQEIASDFQWDKAKIPTAYRRGRDGPICITDGQHTTVAAAGAGITEMNIQLFEVDENLSDDDFEMLLAEQFAYINGKVKKMDRFTTHKVDLIRKKSTALQVQKTCDMNKVTLIPSSKKKFQMAGSMTHIETAYKMVTQINEASANAAYTFHRKYWPNSPIESTIVWALARFFKQFAIYKREGDAGAQFDEALIYKVLTHDGLRDLKEVDSFLHNFFAETGARNANNGDIWRAKAIRIAYNKYVDKNQLGADKRLDPTIY